MKQTRIPKTGKNLSLCTGILSTYLLGCGPEGGTSFSGSPYNPEPPKQSEDVKSAESYQFTAGRMETVTVTIDTGFGLVRQLIPLQQKAKTEEKYTQVNRTVQTEQFVQGHGGNVTIDTFPVAEAGLFDLLILIDDSSSMASYQERLATRLPSILKHISNTNWQIAVATTTSSCLAVSPAGTRIISKAQYEADPILTEHEFRSLIRIGEGGNPVERGILMATDALNGKCNGDINPWVRNESTRAILLLTDEHNCGSAVNEGCSGQAHETAQYFFNHAPSNVTVSGLLLLQEPPGADPNNPNDPNHACQASGGYDSLPNPSEYLNMIQGTGGFVGDICRSNYDSLLEQISLDVKDRINMQFELSYPPVAGSLSVQLDGQTIQDFSVSNRILTINEAISPDAHEIEISYQHSPVVRRSVFPLNHQPDGHTFQVTVNGKVVGRNQYSYDPFTNELIFRELPADRSQIRVEFRQNDPLKQEFAISHDFVADSVEVMINGKAEKNINIDKANGKVFFAQAPRDNAKISLRYERPGDKTETYDIQGVDLEKLEKVRVIDRRSAEEIAVNIENKKLRFPPEQVWDKREVVVEYDLLFEGEELEFSVPLPNNFFSNSLKILADEDDSLCTYDLQLNQDRLDFRCDNDSMETIEVSYEFSEEYNNVFTLPINFVGPKTWSVEVNGKPIDQFHVFDQTVVILKDFLPAGAEVKIDVAFAESGLAEAKKERKKSKKP
ncbi:MAG: hypothetical protein ACOH5I_09680 [Oligoflexus sp.]